MTSFIGKTFGVNKVLGVVVRRPGVTRYRQIWLKCVCTGCGREKFIVQHELNKPAGRSCRCLSGRHRAHAWMRKARSHIGERHGNWLIVGIRLKRTIHGSIRALARCLRCNTLHGPILSQVLHGKSTECDSCSRAERRGLEPYEHLYKNLRSQRKDKVVISFSEYSRIIGIGKCSWCGGDLGCNPRNKNHGAGWRLDRFDNTKKYELGNCVPCCSFCNYEKSDMNPQEWKDRLVAIRGKSKGLKLFLSVKDYLHAQKSQKSVTVRS